MSSNTNSNNRRYNNRGESISSIENQRVTRDTTIDSTRGAVRIVTTPTIEQPNGRAEIKEYQRI